jgi:hypothetical protein
VRRQHPDVAWDLQVVEDIAALEDHRQVTWAASQDGDDWGIVLA